MISAIVLFILGAGPVRGFAITLGIGIVTSVFTSIYVTRIMIEFWYNYRKPTVVVV
jgi:preprotein translocase subunit SecD